MQALNSYPIDIPQRGIQVITDDIHINDEISEASQDTRYIFMKTEPAPKRIPDKVSNYFMYSSIF